MNTGQQTQTPPAWAPGEGATPAAVKAAQDWIDKSDAWLCSLKPEQSSGSFAGEAATMMQGLEFVYQAMQGWHVQAGSDIKTFASKLKTLREVIGQNAAQEEIAKAYYDAIKNVDQLQKALTGYETAMGREDM